MDDTVTRDDSWLIQHYTPSKRASEESGCEEKPDSVLDRLSRQPEGKYTAGRSIGSGGMKHVTEVRDADACRSVALAVPHSEERDPERWRRFVREAQITAMLEHPNIVPVHDIGQTASGRPFFTMRLLGGRSLEEILKDLDRGVPEVAAAFSLPTLLGIFQQVLNAIAYAHSRGIVHRDLKPANIQVGEYGEVSVIDWGLAKVMAAPDPSWLEQQDERLAETLEQTMDGMLKGSPGYMAPEQASRRIKEIDERTDVYALGGVLYSILTYKPPVQGKTLRNLLNNTQSGSIVPPHRRRPGFTIPAPLEAVALKALATRPADRYETAVDLRADIQAYTDGYATSAEEVGLLRLAWLLIMRHRLPAGILVGSAVLLLLLSVYTVIATRASERRAFASQQQAESNEKRALQALADLRKEQKLRSKMAAPAVAQLLSDARRATRVNDYDQAFQALTLAAAVSTAESDTWILLGLMHLGREEFAKAADALGQGLARLPEAPPPKAKRRAGDKKVTPRKVVRALQRFAVRQQRLLDSSTGRLPVFLIRPFIEELEAIGKTSKGMADTVGAGCYLLLRRNAEAYADPEYRQLLLWYLKRDEGRNSRVEVQWQVHGERLNLIIERPTRTLRLAALQGLPISILTVRGEMHPKSAPYWSGMHLKRLDLSKARQLSTRLPNVMSVDEVVLAPDATLNLGALAHIKGLRRVIITPPGSLKGINVLRKKGIEVIQAERLPPLP